MSKLTRERVLAAAIEIADEDGIDALTMRRLGGRLDVEAMSLYKHVANKGAILDGIVDAVIGEIELPSVDTDWRTAMQQRARSARHVLASHPWAIGMMESRDDMGPAALRYIDAVIGSLRAGGFSPAMAGRAFFLLDSYVYGFVIQESNFTFDMNADAADVADEVAASLPADEYPHLIETAAAYAAAGDEPVDEFEYGLALILDALTDRRDE